MFSLFKKGLVIGAGICVPILLLTIFIAGVQALPIIDLVNSQKVLPAPQYSAEIRYIEEYKDGKLINKIPYTVSAEEVMMESWARSVTVNADAAINTLENWDKASASQKLDACKTAMYYFLLKYKQEQR